MEEFELIPLQIEGLPTPVVVHEEHYAILDYGGFRLLWLRGPWQPSWAEVGRRFGVTAVEANSLDGWTDGSIGFLDELPGLRSVHISTLRQLDWGPLERQIDLESVWVSPAGKETSELDFTRLRKLRKCRLSWCPQFDSIRRCSWLKSLLLRESGDLRTLDLRELVELEELMFFQCCLLRDVLLAERARIRSLQISCCPGLRLDLRRFGRELEYLCLEGVQGSRLEDLRLAKRLKKIELGCVTTKGRIPAFMADLPCLEEARVYHTELSEEDERVLDRLPSVKRDESRRRKKLWNGLPENEPARQIVGAEKVVEWFGRWPSFHDAEVQRLVLERTGCGDDPGPTVELVVHAFEMTGEVDERGRYVLTKHCLVQFRFVDVVESEISGFNHQNVIGELRFERSGSADGEGVEVVIEGSFGVSGRLRCRRVEVVSVEGCNAEGG